MTNPQKIEDAPRCGEVSRRTVSIAEAARLLGVGRGSAYEAVRRGEIPAIRIGRRRVVSKVALEAMLSAGTHPLAEGRSDEDAD